MKSLVGIIVPGALAVVGAAALLVWTVSPLVGSLEARVPGTDRPGTSRGAQAEVAPKVGQPIRGDGKPSQCAGSWPWFLGPRRDGICDDGVALARQWPEEGPEKLWSVEMGQGYAAAAVQDGCVYVLDYDEKKLADTMRCLSLNDGREIWRNSYPVPIKTFHGMSRTVSAIVGDRVISFGPKCQVTCWDRNSGESPWLIDLVIEHGATVPQWYAGQCPLIDGDLLILAPGGEALVMAVDYKTGEVRWQSPNPRSWKMTHVSIVSMEFAGRKMYVYCGKGGVAGVSADDGSILWETTDWKIGIATCPSPVVLPEGKIFCSGGYNAGAAMLQLKEEGGKIAVETLFRLKARQFGSTQQTPIFFDGHLYGVRENDKQLVCLDPDGKELWSSGRKEKFGSGPYLIADGMIFVLDDSGTLTLAEASPDGYKRLARAKILDGHDAWGPMALVAGRLILRDFRTMACIDVAK